MDQPTRDDSVPESPAEGRQESTVGRSARLLRFASKYRHLFGAAEPTAAQDAQIAKAGVAALAN